MPSGQKDESEKQEIRELVRQMEDLPTLPSVAVSIMNILLDEASSAQDVADIVEVDPALTMKLLMVANSAFYGIAREVSTVRQAIVALGFSRMRSLILSLSVLDTVEAMAEESELDSSEFWTHSLREFLSHVERTNQRENVQGQPGTAGSMWQTRGGGKWTIVRCWRIRRRENQGFGRASRAWMIRL